MTHTLGFDGDPERWIRTAEVAARMGISVKRFHNIKAERTAANFPAPVGPSLWRLGDLQAWARAGGMRQARVNGALALNAARVKVEDNKIITIRRDIARRLAARKA